MSPDPMRASSASVTLYTEPNAPLLPPAIGASALVLIRSYRASRAPETSDAAVLVWFWLRPWQRPCLVPFRGGETATAAPMYQNYTLALRPQTSRVPGEWGRAFARHLLRSILLTNV